MAEAKAIFETNFFGALRVSRAATAALRDSRGVLINMSSVARQIGPPSTPHYCNPSARASLLSSGATSRPRFISEATRQGPYAAAFEKFLSKRRAFGEKASTAEPVAALVARILNAPEFELRYVAAMPSQRLLLLIKRYAPQRVYEWSLRKILCQYRRGD